MKNKIQQVFINSRPGRLLFNLSKIRSLLTVKREINKSFRYVLTYNKEELILKSKHEGSRFMLINEGLYEYGYFNFSFLANMLSSVVHVLSEGYFPVIKLNGRKDGWTNWDTFFEQPFECNANFESLPFCKVKSGRIQSTFKTPFNEDELKMWCKVYNDFVIFNPNTKAYIEKEYQDLIFPRKRILGVLCRGTDYVKTKPDHHPIQPSVEELMEASRDKMRELTLEYIYLATEEKRIVDQFEKEFPGHVIVNKRSYYDEIYYNNNLSEIYQVNFDRKDDIYLKGLEYLSSIYLLSRCNALVAGNCGGSCAALYMNNMKYEDWKLFDLGLYGIDDV